MAEVFVVEGPATSSPSTVAGKFGARLATLEEARSTLMADELTPEYGLVDIEISGPVIFRLQQVPNTLTWDDIASPRYKAPKPYDIGEDEGIQYSEASCRLATEVEVKSFYTNSVNGWLGYSESYLPVGDHWVPISTTRGEYVQVGRRDSRSPQTFTEAYGYLPAWAGSAVPAVRFALFAYLPTTSRKVARRTDAPCVEAPMMLAIQDAYVTKSCRDVVPVAAPPATITRAVVRGVKPPRGSGPVDGWRALPRSLRRWSSLDFQDTHVMGMDADGNLNPVVFSCGSIVLWYPTGTQTIPLGWALCDGTNNTPN
jgi:hypothetical protein